MRWFGNDHIPELDLNSITKKTICSIPLLSNNVQSPNFHADVTLLKDSLDLTKVNIDDATSLSLLSLATKSTIDLIQKDDGQYLSFVVSGNQQTSNIAFHVKGKMVSEVQKMNHYANTYDMLKRAYGEIAWYVNVLEQVAIGKENLKD